jgi:hypothetical protein
MGHRAVARLIVCLVIGLFSATPLYTQGNHRPGVVRGIARSDAAGTFMLSGVPPGPSLLTLYHPTLDSAGLSVPPVMVDVTSETAPTSGLQRPAPS